MRSRDYLERNHIHFGQAAGTYIGQAMNPIHFTCANVSDAFHTRSLKLVSTMQCYDACR